MLEAFPLDRNAYEIHTLAVKVLKLPCIREALGIYPRVNIVGSVRARNSAAKLASAEIDAESLAGQTGGVITPGLSLCVAGCNPDYSGKNSNTEHKYAGDLLDDIMRLMWLHSLWISVPNRLIGTSATTVLILRGKSVL